mmetsp:Transcript_8734/g.21215  ORF Transcript_8734/g.21215 Transcript_8734/m.21215 type:complete len:235 (-) Transcript_8734:131-835(-)|eukprot:CAMPEP_0178998916 /NCGR_PEP_ID=MMETSP0795-20121207/9765_1 /TAXON_ID=88552 /ORGANISM="Amoebophrya sp., Strain Ameob2" /LENGTH=234 /DNA_ID=CAMNT_0020691621 /DNA_START=139 /DNA_END=843 /DNA_ORIENTATION=+
MPLLKQEKLTAFNPQNFHQYKEEVTAGVYEDWKRDTVDNAKKRAVTQAPTYHAFEQLVAGCTLKPINKKDFDAPPKVLEPNKYGRKPDAKLEVGCGKTGSSSGGRKVGRKMRGGEFTTLWHRAKGLGDRVGLLQRVAESDRELTVFHSVEPDLLEDVLDAALRASSELSAEADTTVTNDADGGDASTTVAIPVAELASFVVKALKENKKSHFDFCIGFLSEELLSRLKEKEVDV